MWVYSVSCANYDIWKFSQTLKLKADKPKKKKHPGNVDYSKQLKLEYLLKGFALSMKTSTKFNILEIRNTLISLKLLFGDLSA